MCEYGIKKLDNNLNLKSIKYHLAKESDFIAYTDGSYKDPKQNGYGVVITNKNEEILITESKKAISFDKSIKDMSNTKAELIAVLRAIEIAINKEVSQIIKNRDIQRYSRNLLITIGIYNLLCRNSIIK